MTTVSVRDFSHQMAKYLKKVRSGQAFMLTYRNKPIAQLTPNKPKNIIPGWKRPIKRIKIKGEPLSQTIIRMRREDWR